MTRLERIAAIAAAAVFATPLIVYVAEFGAYITADHSRWGEFGSAMAGIYAPIAALATIAVLLKQTALQAQINRHQYEQSFVAQARSDVEFYGARLVQAIESFVLPGQSVRQSVTSNFLGGSPAKLRSPQSRELAANIHSGAPAAFDIWFAVDLVLDELFRSRARASRLALDASKQKLIALLGRETCVALDNFHAARTGGKTAAPYHFSRIMSG